VNRLAAFVCLLLAGPLFGQTVVRIKDDRGNVVAELTIPANGGVEVIHPGPVNPLPNPVPPNPVPPQPLPPNPPPPLPPAPVVGTAKHVVVVRDDTPGVMTAAQAAALRDPALRAEVSRRKLFWHVFDVASAEVQSPPPAGKGYAKWLASGKEAQPGVRTTGLFLLDAQGRLVVPGVPLPADAASILAAIKAASGG
jgi:hypothetical protein